MAKSRVAPLKKRTLPQLEVMAALIGARMAHFIQQTLQKCFSSLSIHMWSDSQIVLHWLNSGKPLPQFVANRKKEIKQLCPASCWHYCSTCDNPADLLTRGITSSQLQSSTIWLKGHSWLTSENQWPAWSVGEATTLSSHALVAISSSPINATHVQLKNQAGLHRIIDYLRCSGRIHNAPLSELTKFPYLLPSKHPFIDLVI